MNVLFIASEGSPFIKTGGLADVIGSLPGELQKEGLTVGVMLPLYQDIPTSYRKEMTLVKELEVPVGWRRQYAGLYKLTRDRVTYYFIDNEHYFKREGLYGFYDEAERFAFFSRGALESLPHLDFVPQILHCHDWQTGLVSVLLKAYYGNDPFYRDIRTVFTIHNLHYKGVFPPEILQDLLGLPGTYLDADGLEFYGQVSYLKGGLTFSDLLLTVSETYASEIQTPQYGEGMDGVLWKRRQDLHGVVNGIDYDEYNPLTDPHIAVRYRSSIEKKKQNKAALQELLGLPQEMDIPLLVVVSRLVGQKVDLLAQGLPELLGMDIQLAILGTGDEMYCGFLDHHARLHPEKMAVRLTFDEGLARKFYAGADIFLMPSSFEPCGLSQMLAMRYGTIPVVRETGGLKDTVLHYDPATGEGNGFTFNDLRPQPMLDAISKAIDCYRDVLVWSAIVKNAVKSNFSWRESAKKYKSFYEGLAK